MNNYERLEDEACEDGVEIVSCDFESDRIHGLYADGVIGMSSTLTTLNPISGAKASFSPAYSRFIIVFILIPSYTSKLICAFSASISSFKNIGSLYASIIFTARLH